MQRPSRGAELLFQVPTEREEKELRRDRLRRIRRRLDQDPRRPRLCAAIVDRLTVGGNIIETGTDSYRLAHTRSERRAKR